MPRLSQLAVLAVLAPLYSWLIELLVQSQLLATGALTIVCLGKLLPPKKTLKTGVHPIFIIPSPHGQKQEVGNT